MNRYEPSSHRPIFAAAAAVMTALTLLLAVGVPASLAPAGHDASALAAARRGAAGPTVVTIHPSRIEVIGARETNVAVQPARPRS